MYACGCVCACICVSPTTEGSPSPGFLYHSNPCTHTFTYIDYHVVVGKICITTIILVCHYYYFFFTFFWVNITLSYCPSESVISKANMKGSLPFVRRMRSYQVRHPYGMAREREGQFHIQWCVLRQMGRCTRQGATVDAMISRSREKRKGNSSLVLSKGVSILPLRILSCSKYYVQFWCTTLSLILYVFFDGHGRPPSLCTQTYTYTKSTASVPHVALEKPQHNMRTTEGDVVGAPRGSKTYWNGSIQPTSREMVVFGT